MPTFKFTAPDGRVYRVNGPEGATQEQAFAMLQQQLGNAAPATEPEPPATGLASEGQSPRLPRVLDPLGLTTPGAMTDAAAGFGAGVMDTARSGMQMLPQLAPALKVADLVTGVSKSDQVQKSIDEAARLDAPLKSSKYGALGATAEQILEMYFGGKGLGALGRGAKLLPGGKAVAEGMAKVLNKPGAGMLRRVAQEGARGGAAMGAYEATRPVTSDESRVGNVVSATGQGAAFQGLLGPVVGTLGRKGIEWMRGKMDAGKVSFAQARAELEKMGVRNVNQTALGKAVSLINSGKTDDLEQALRLVENDMEKIGLRQAQVTQDMGALSRDRMLSQQSMAPDAAAGIKQQFENQTSNLDAARVRAIEGVLPGADEAQRIGPNLGSEVQAPLLKAEEAARKKYKELYDKVDSDPSARISEIAFSARDKATGKSAQDRFMEIASKMGRQTRDTIPRTSGYAERLLELTKPGQPLRLSEFESIRKSLGKMSTGNDAEAVFAAELKGVLDDTLDKAVDRGLVKSSNLPNIVDMLKQARAAKRQHTVDFRGDDIIARIVGKKWRSGEVDTPMMDTGKVADALFGSAGKAGKGFTFAPNFEKDMELLKRRLGPGTDGWNAVRAEALNRLVSRAITEDSKTVGRFLQENQRRLSKVLEPGDLEALHRLSRMKGAVASGTKGMPPSGDSVQSLSRTITSGLMGVTPMIGAAVGTGDQGSSLDNVFMGLALAGGSAIARRRMGSKYRAEAARGATPTPVRKPQPAPKAPLLPMMSLLEYLRNRQGEQQ